MGTGRASCLKHMCRSRAEETWEGAIPGGYNTAGPLWQLRLAAQLWGCIRSMHAPGLQEMPLLGRWGGSVCKVPLAAALRGRRAARGGRAEVPFRVENPDVASGKGKCTSTRRRACAVRIQAHKHP